MGLGPWAMAEHQKMLLKSERDRFRRIVSRELAIVFADQASKMPDYKVIEMLERIKSKIAPKR
jgi:hypothetical protein